MICKKNIVLFGLMCVCFVIACQDPHGIIVHGISRDYGLRDPIAHSSIDGREKTPASPPKTPRLPWSAAHRNDGLKVDAPNVEYATDVHLIAGCEESPSRIAVAAGHTNPALCEHIVAQAARDDNGDYYEVDTSFDWTVSNSSVAALECQNGPHDNFCWANGKQDFFTTGSLAEPSTIVTACAQNVCPTPRPIDCMDFLCQSVEVISVIDLEGEWTFTGYQLDTPAHVAIAQDGRSLTGDALSLEKGTITDTSVSFIIGDYAYYGMVTDNRSHLLGTVRDQIGDELIGDWSAEKLGP